MNTIKFTSDGKKVAVIGKLNAQETIVQEIFIVGDAEIPSGENFVVKSLHDAPAISWKEKTIKDLELRYDRERKEWESKIDEQRRRLDSFSHNLSDRIAFVGSSLKNANEESFDMIIKFIQGKFNFVVNAGNYDKEIKAFGSQINGHYDSYQSWDKMKLLTLFGSDDGKLQWHIGRYSDGSGSSTHYEFFETHDQAVKYIDNWVNDGDLDWGKIRIAEKYSIQVDAEKLKKLKSIRAKEVEKNIAQAKEVVQKHEKELIELTD